jgi:endonuclease YncB( thermonuclease family)
MSSQPPIEPRAIPHAGRPRGAAWRALQAEGVEWEAQVLIGDGEKTLSARLIVTSERLAFARGGDVVLDIARWWLKQPPFLSGNGTINLRIETGNGHRDRMQFAARDGRQVATDFVALMTHGKQALLEPEDEPQFTRVPERKRSVMPPDRALEPERPAVVRAVEHKYSSDVIDAATLEVLDPTDFPPLTEAATPTTNLRNAPDGGRGSSEPITISTLANQSHRSGEWSLSPIPSMMQNSGKLSRAGWAFRLSGLLLLIALAAAFGTDRLPHTPGLPSKDTFISAPSDNTPTQVSVAQSLPTSTQTSLIPFNEDSATVAAAQTSIALGVGAETVDLAPTEAVPTATPSRTSTMSLSDTGLMPAEVATETETSVPPVADTETALPTESTATDVPVATDTIQVEVPEATATETLVDVATETETVTLEPTVTDTIAATEVLATATPIVAAEETHTPTPGATETETSVPSATSAPTVTSAPTEPATVTATSAPTGTATPGFPSQPKTVDEAGNPAQVFATGAFRYTVEFAERGTELPQLELAAVTDQDWVVVVLYAENWSDEPATLNMADFQLLVSGDFGWQFVGMDATSTQTGQFLGFDPVLEPTDLSSIKDGEGIRMALVFSIPTASTGMELIDDTSGLNLSDSFAIGGDVTNLGSAPAVPELVSATVTEILDGRTIVVTDADGYTATIQYLGINVPTGDACYTAEATQLNSDITLGQTVYLEREYRNHVTTDGESLARDVWIDNQQGGLVLVSAWMASEGAAVASPANQDTRFAGWILAAAGSAEANVYGFWATCGEAPVGASPDQTPTDDTSASLPIDPLVNFDN